MFALHERLAADTVPLRALPLCRVLLMNNAAWPWLILVPARPGISELHHLDRADRTALVEEVAAISGLVERLYAPDKLNVAAIGNIVPQLHVHVVARRRDDPAWPGPVWGSGLGGPYEAAALARAVARLDQALDQVSGTAAMAGESGRDAART